MFLCLFLYFCAALITPVILHRRPSGFSACNVEKLGMGSGTMPERTCYRHCLLGSSSVNITPYSRSFHFSACNIEGWEWPGDEAKYVIGIASKACRSCRSQLDLWRGCIRFRCLSPTDQIAAFYDYDLYRYTDLTWERRVSNEPHFLCKMLLEATLPELRHWL